MRKQIIACATVGVSAALLVAPQARADDESSISFVAPAAIHPGGGSVVQGTLHLSSSDSPADSTIHVTREVHGELTQLDDLTMCCNNTFTLRDAAVANPLDVVTYTFSWAGGLGDPPAEASLALTVAGRPWDFDSDGYADLAVAAPLKSVSGHAGAGAVTVIPGGPSGPRGAGTKVWTQDSPGVPGGAESKDNFGWALSSGDYDGDGYADLAVGAPGEDVGGKADVGWVTVLRGSAGGLSGAYSPTEAITPKANKFAGEALTSLDSDGDGRDELAMGMSGVKKVAVYAGTATGATKLLHVFDSQDTNGSVQSSNGFGMALTDGDFNNDGYGDLVVGAPYDWQNFLGVSVGAIAVIPGSAQGFEFWRSRQYNPDTAGIKGKSHNFGAKDSSDFFGGLLAAGDLNGDGYDDIAVGAPGVPVARNGVKFQDAGEVHVLLGTSTGIQVKGNRLFTMDSPGVPGKATASGGFGRSLDVGEDRDSASATLAVGSFLQSVTLLPAGSPTGAVAITQETPGVPGGTEPEDDFGSFVRFAPFFSGGREALAVSALGENVGGAVMVLPDGSAGIAPTQGSFVLTQESEGIPGSSASHDWWGWLSDSH